MIFLLYLIKNRGLAATFDKFYLNYRNEIDCEISISMDWVTMPDE